MKKILFGIALIIASLLGLTACYPPNTVVVFGDSLVVQSTDALAHQHPGVIVNAFGGTSVCDWADRMKQTADQAPKIVIASFVGNVGPAGSCRGLGPNDPNYWGSLALNVISVSQYYNDKHILLYWAAYPVRGFPSIYPIGDWTRVQYQYQYAASKYPQYVHWFDAGLTVAPNHVYTDTINGTTVRQPDKLHFTPAGGDMYARELLKPAI